MSYVGQTKLSLEKRIKGHKDAAKKAKAYFPHAIRIYGIENFEWIIIDRCKTREELNKKEKHYIKMCNTKRPNGYNLGSGGEGGDHWLGRSHTNESKKKMSLKAIGRPPSLGFKGNQHSEQTKRLIREKLTGRKLPMATRIKMSQVRKGVSIGPKSLESKLRQCRGYLFINPKGEEIICKIGFKNFCRKYQLSISSMWRILKEEKDNWNGWIVRHMEA